MKAVIPAHRYELLNFESDGSLNQILQFIHKAKDEKTGEFVTIKNGTTNEEVISCVIDRITHLNQLTPSSYNEEAVLHLNKALEALIARTADRVEREVEGTIKE